MLQTLRGELEVALSLTGTGDVHALDPSVRSSMGTADPSVPDDRT